MSLGSSGVGGLPIDLNARLWPYSYDRGARVYVNGFADTGMCRLAHIPPLHPHPHTPPIDVSNRCLLSQDLARLARLSYEMCESGMYRRYAAACMLYARCRLCACM